MAAAKEWALALDTLLAPSKEVYAASKKLTDDMAANLRLLLRDLVVAETTLADTLTRTSAEIASLKQKLLAQEAANRRMEANVADQRKAKSEAEMSASQVAKQLDGITKERDAALKRIEELQAQIMTYEAHPSVIAAKKQQAEAERQRKITEYESALKKLKGE